MMMSHTGHRNPVTFLRLILFGEDHDQEFPGTAAYPALGRPSLLSPQPDQPEPALRQRRELHGRLRHDVLRSDDVGANRLAGLDDLTPGRAFLLRAARLRPH